MYRIKKYLTAPSANYDGLRCTLCGLEVHGRGPCFINGPAGTRYVDLGSLEGHFLTNHVDCRIYTADGNSYIWVYSDGTNDRLRGISGLSVCRVSSSLLIELFPQLLFVKWENPVVDLLLKFAKECAVEKRHSENDLDVVTISGMLITG